MVKQPPGEVRNSKLSHTGMNRDVSAASSAYCQQGAFQWPPRSLQPRRFNFVTSLTSLVYVLVSSGPLITQISKIKQGGGGGGETSVKEPSTSAGVLTEAPAQVFGSSRSSGCNQRLRSLPETLVITGDWVEYFHEKAVEHHFECSGNKLFIQDKLRHDFELRNPSVLSG